MKLAAEVDRFIDPDQRHFPLPSHKRAGSAYRLPFPGRRLNRRVKKIKKANKTEMSCLLRLQDKLAQSETTRLQFELLAGVAAAERAQAPIKRDV